MSKIDNFWPENFAVEDEDSILDILNKLALELERITNNKLKAYVSESNEGNIVKYIFNLDSLPLGITNYSLFTVSHQGSGDFPVHICCPQIQDRLEYCHGRNIFIEILQKILTHENIKIDIQKLLQEE